MPGGSPDEELLVEGCPHPTCQVIRIYDLQTGHLNVVYEKLRPHKLCTGPENTVLVCDWKTNSILVLAPADGRFRCIRGLGVGLQFLPVQGMCYSSQYDAVVFSKVHQKEVIAVKLETGEVLWQTTKFEPEDVCSTPNGWICVANRANVLVLNASNGTKIFNLSIRKEDDVLDTTAYPIRRPARRQKIVMGVLMYTLSPFRTQEDIPSHLQSFHKITWCEDEGCHKVAVQLGEQTVITYNVTSMPTGNVTLDTCN